MAAPAIPAYEPVPIQTVLADSLVRGDKVGGMIHFVCGETRVHIDDGSKERVVCARLTISADAVFLIARQMLAVASGCQKWLTPEEREAAGLKETH